MNKEQLANLAEQNHLQAYFGLDQTIIAQQTYPKHAPFADFGRIYAKIDETKPNHYQIKNPKSINDGFKKAIVDYAKTPIDDRLTLTFNPS